MHPRPIEALAYSSLWVGAAAGLLLVAACAGLEIEPRLDLVGLAIAGTLVVYNVDRLRDLTRDRATAPRRSAFVAAHRDRLAQLTAIAALAAALCATSALFADGRALWLLAPAALLGFLHRRLKRLAWGKALYITAAWLVVVVGLPALLTPGARHARWVAAILGLALLANAVASNVRDRDRKSSAALFGSLPALHFARAAAASGVLAGLLAPPPARPLAAIPLATLLALLPFRPSERYGLVVVDGALIAGALLALAAGTCSGSVPGRPADAAQQPALPAVAHAEGVVHPGPGRLVLRRNLAG